MANFDHLTRKQQILEKLVDEGDWVDGSRLATEEIGGSEGLRRLRELVAEGYPIEKRPHPDPGRDVWQYRYRRREGGVSIRRAVVSTEAGYTYVAEKPELLPVEESEPISERKFVKLPPKIKFGSVAVCPRCKAKTRQYNYNGLEGLRHKDPFKNKRPCLGCNGWGIVPNVGPIPMTPPEGLK